MQVMLHERYATIDIHLPIQLTDREILQLLLAWGLVTSDFPRLFLLLSMKTYCKPKDPGDHYEGIMCSNFCHV